MQIYNCVKNIILTNLKLKIEQIDRATMGILPAYCNIIIVK